LNSALVRAEASEQIHDLDILSAIWSSSNQIICGSMDHSISITDVEKLQKKVVLRTADSVPTSVDARHDNILSAHEDGYVRMWD
jgi:WD40 repeat protein